MSKVTTSIDNKSRKTHRSKQIAREFKRANLITIVLRIIEVVGLGATVRNRNQGVSASHTARAYVGTTSRNL